MIADVALPYFLCGEENRLLAYAATADISVLRIGNPVLIIGPSGVGKTAVAMHLAARAGIFIGDETDAGEPAETLYIPASDYARDYAEAIEVDDLQSLQSRLLEAPVLIIDDLHGIGKKMACQGELARRIEDRAAAGRMTFLTAHRMPDQTDHMDHALASRIMAGLTIPLTYPSVATRLRLLSEFAIALDVPLDEPTIAWVETQLPSETSTRGIESLVRAVQLRQRIDGHPADREMIADAMSASPTRTVVTMEKIVRVVARHFSITTASLRGPSRHRTTVRVRWLAMWLSRKLVGVSTHQIGAHFGNRDHTSVMHALAKIDAAIVDDMEMQLAAQKIEDRLLH